MDRHDLSASVPGMTPLETAAHTRGAARGEAQARHEDFAPAPNSWYYLGHVSEIEKRPLRFELPNGQAFVAFLTASGRFGVLSARCCHMGTDLARGCVVGERLACPLHGWEFSTDGDCERIPVQPDIPAFARQTSYPVEERNGHLFFYNQTEARFPLPFFPGVRPEELHPARAFTREVQAPWYFVAANGFDVQHFLHAHDRRVVGEPVVDCAQDSSRRMCVRLQIIGDSLTDRLTRLFAGPEFTLTVTAWGGAMALVQAAFKHTTSYGWAAIQPLPANRTRLKIIVWARRSRAPAARFWLDPASAWIRSCFIPAVPGFGHRANQRCPLRSPPFAPGRFSLWPTPRLAAIEAKPVNVATMRSHTSNAFDIGPIDRSRRFIPEHITPLAHTAIFAELPGPVRLRYNQLMASCYHEHFIHLERMLSELILPALIQRYHGSVLEPRLVIFRDEERKHTAWFHALHRATEPGLYRDNYYHFLHVPRLGQRLLSACARRPARFPFCLWIAMIIEERTIPAAREMLLTAHELEPHYVTLHRLHAADEAGHVSCDAEVLRDLWPTLSAPNRWFNRFMFVTLLREFFGLPKRAGWRVILRLSEEHPELQPQLPRLRRELLALEHNLAYRGTLYSRRREPRTFALADNFPEMQELEAALLGASQPQSAVAGREAESA
jgi:nitrite reductase/ring-hydroxylating ferredoxin subunit